MPCYLNIDCLDEAISAVQKDKLCSNFLSKDPISFFSQVDLIAVMHLCDYRQLLKLNLSGSLAAELGRLSHMQIM